MSVGFLVLDCSTRRVSACSGVKTLRPNIEPKDSGRSSREAVVLLVALFREERERARG